MILTPGREGAVYVHASDDLRLLRILRGHDEMIYFVDISPDNRFAASASMDKTVRIWDLAAGKEIVTLEGQNDSIGCVQFSPNGHLLASTTLRQVQLWRCRDWERVATLPRQDTSGIGGIAFIEHCRLLPQRIEKQIRLTATILITLCWKVQVYDLIPVVT